MELTVVGCSGSTSGPSSAASSYLVQAPHQGRTFSLVLDLGPGAFGALYHYLDPREIDAIALSHLHPDHCLDLCAYHVWSRYSPGGPWPRRPVYGPVGTRARLVAAYEVPSPDQATEPGPGIGDSLDYHDWQPDQQIGPFLVRTARVAHSVEAFAIRVEEGAVPRQASNPDRQTPDPDAPTWSAGPTMVYSGDTGPCDALVELARGADLLLVEAAFLEHPENPPGLHLTPAEAAAAGSAAGAGRVVITHIPPWHDPGQALAEARRHSGVPLELASSGAHWTFA